LEGEKACLTCGQIKRYEEFHKAPGIGGRNAHCKTCRNLSRRQTIPKPSPISTIDVDGENIKARSCTRCEEIKPMSDYGNAKRGLEGKKAICKSCESLYRLSKREIDAPSKLRNTIRRRTISKNLRSDLSSEEMNVVYERFDKRCALTGSLDYEVEHFIPVSWGRGGTYYGNIYLLDARLNAHKFNKNPFDWIEDPEIDGLINPRKWIALIEWLASLNNLSVERFKMFVYWCDENRRSADELEKDDRCSLEIWRCRSVWS
jgi:hypothetical protein